MLVLSRYVGQSFFIGDDIEIKVLGVRGDQVKVGVTAPKDVMVLREELRRAEKAGLSPKKNPAPEAGSDTKKVTQEK